MFPDHIVDAVKKLREGYHNRKVCVVLNFPVIEILKYGRHFETSTKLFYYSSNNTLEIHAPDYRYLSKISHFDFKRAERRWTRSKDQILPLIKDLQSCGLWDYVSNKDFLIVNTLNNRVKIEDRWDLLNKITGV